jgi:hypothetical protein
MRPLQSANRGAGSMLAHGPTHGSVLGIHDGCRPSAVAVDDMQLRSGTYLKACRPQRRNRFGHLRGWLFSLYYRLFLSHDWRHDRGRPRQESPAKPPSPGGNRRPQDVRLALLVQQERPLRRQLTQLCNRQARTPLTTRRGVTPLHAGAAVRRSGLRLYLVITDKPRQLVERVPVSQAAEHQLASRCRPDGVRSVLTEAMTQLSLRLSSPGCIDALATTLADDALQLWKGSDIGELVQAQSEPGRQKTVAVEIVSDRHDVFDQRRDQRCDRLLMLGRRNDVKSGPRSKELDGFEIRPTAGPKNVRIGRGSDSVLSRGEKAAALPLRRFRDAA